MDTYPTLDKNSSQAAPGIASRSPVVSKATGAAAAPAMARETLRFPGEDGGKSLSEMAQRDLDATLQLLAERAQYITGASGVAIALREGENMVCCASAGPSAPAMGTHLQIDSGLSAESVRTRQTLHCDDAENDARVNRESCRALGIASVVVMPLVSGDEVYGVFELLAGRPRAFEERDFTALQRLSEMIQTAVNLADGARRAEKEFSVKPEPAIAGKAAASNSRVHSAAEGFVALPAGRETNANPTLFQAKIVQAKVVQANAAEARPAETMPAATTLPEMTSVESTAAGMSATEAKVVEAKSEGAAAPDSTSPSSTSPSKFGKVGSCASCGFPISEGRRLCLDCEAASPNVDSANRASHLFEEQSEPEPNWIRSHLYVIAAAVFVIATIAVVVWRL